MVQMALRAKVDRARSYWRTLLAAEGGFWTLAVLLAAFVLCFHVDRLLALSIEGRIGAWSVLGVLFSAGVIFLILRPVLKPITSDLVATMVERHFPHLRERLLSAIEFSEADPNHLRGVSPTLLSDLRTEAEREAGGLDFQKAFQLKPLARAALTLAFAALLLGLHAAFAPQAFGRFIERMALMHKPVWRDTMPQVDPPETKILKGTDLVVGVDIEGKHVPTARLQFKFGDGRWNSVEMKADNKGEFQHRFAAVTEDVTYRATAGDGISDYGKAKVVDPASIVGAKLTLNYPPYMDKPAQTFPADSGGVAAPVGTKVAIELKANKPLELATATLPGEQPKPWPVAGNLVTGTLTVKSNGQYSLRLKDTDGFMAPDTQSFPIKAIPDQVPEVQLIDPTGDLDVVPDAHVPLHIVAKDDYGVSEVRVPYQVENKGAAKVIPAGHADDRKSKSLELENTWSLGGLGLKPGDAIRYHIEATDFDNVTGPHVGKTTDFQIRIIDQGEAIRRDAENRAELLRQMADLIKEQKGAKADVEAQRNAAKPNPEAIAAAEQRQRAAANTAQDISRRVGELNRNAAMNNLADKNEQEAGKNVQQRLDKLSRQDMPEAANKIGTAQSQAQNNAQQAKSQLGAASQQQEQITQELQKLADQMKPGSELGKLADRFQRLAQEQRKLQAETDRLLPQTLGKQMSELSPEQKAALARNAQQQQSLQKATEQAMSDLDKAAQAMQQGRNPEQGEAAKETADNLRQGQVSENQQGAQQNTQQNALGQARTQQENAAKELEKAADQLRQAQNPNDPKQLQRQLQQAMNQLQRQMAQQQDALQQNQKSLTPQERQQLAQQQKELQKQAEQLARQLEKLQRRSPSAGKASQAMQQAGQQQGQASQSLQQNQQNQAQGEQKQALQQMQRAMQSLQQAQAEAKQDENQDPFAELRKKLTALAAKQKAIGQATTHINEAQENGAVQPDDAATLQKLAEQQAQVADETSKLEPELPGDVFKSFSQDARKAMGRSSDGLKAANPKPNPTGLAQRKAQTLLEQLAKALDADPKDNSEEEGGGGGQQGGQGGQQKPDPDLPKRIAEIRLLRFMEQAIRSQTQDLDDSKNSTPDQKPQIDENARQQSDAKSMAERVSAALKRYQNLAGKVSQAGKHMSEAHRGLDQGDTGDSTQEQESQAIIRLTEALKQAQKQQKQQQQQAQRKQQQQQQGKQPGQQQANGQPAPGQGQQQQGGNPAQMSTQRRSTTLNGNLGTYGPDSRGFNGLDPRSQDALRSGAQEKKPVEYQDLINRYLSALSNKGK